MSVLVLIEADGGAMVPTSADPVNLGARLARALGTELVATAVVPDTDSESLAETVGGLGADVLASAWWDGADDFAPLAWASLLDRLAAEHGATVVLGPATDRGNEVLAHLAARRNAPLAAQVLDLVPPGDGASPWSLSRARWAGSVIEDAIVSPGATALLATVAVGSQAASTTTAKPARLARSDFAPSSEDLALVARLERASSGEGVSLSDARVVIGGGRGVGSAEGFELLQRIADKIGGAVGVSRAVTSLGWRPHRDQVGQTGTRIAPELYIACGISGAIQHMVGCKAAKHILAINTDPDAPIMAKADWVVVGDLHEVLSALAKELGIANGHGG